jgi:hypothetical protein
METALRQARANEVHGQARMIANDLDLPTRRNRVSKTKEFGHMGTTLGSSRRARDQNDPETDLQEALVTRANGRQETRQNLSIGARDPRVMETDHPAVLSTEVLALHVMETDPPAVLSTEALALHAMEKESQAVLSTEVPALHVMETDPPAVHSTETLALHAMKTNARLSLSIEVPDLHAMETGALLTKALIDQPKASAFSTMMCQSRYRTRALRANGYTVSTPS